MKNAVYVMPALTLLALSSCDSFLAPKVACEEITLSADLPRVQERAGVECAFPEVLLWRVSHAPKVDPAWAAENGEPLDATLANAQVRVTSGVAGATLCAGLDCSPSASQIDLRVDSRGALTYELMVNLESLGLLPGPGTETTLAGVAANEIYGPGNGCEVRFNVKAKCDKAEE